MNLLAQATTTTVPDPTAVLAAMGGSFLLFGLIGIIIGIAVYYVIIKKTGYNPWLSLLILIPGLGGLIVLVMLVFTEWPIEREVRALRAQSAGGGIPPTGGAIYPTA